MIGRRLWVGLALGVASLTGTELGWQRIRLASNLADARRAAIFADPEAAVTRISDLRARSPRNAELAYLLAIAHRRQGQTANARADIKKAADLGWPLNDLQRQHFLIRFQSGQIEDAKAHLLEMLREGCADDAAVEIYDCMAKGYLADMRLREAQISVEHWLAWQPKSAQAHLMRAEVANGLNDSHAMIAAYRELLSIDPDNRQALWRLGFALLDAHDVRGAKQIFERYLQLDAEDPMGHLGLAICRRQMGEIGAAKAGFEKALAGSLPGMRRAAALTELGQIAVSEKSYEQAREYLKEALRLLPTSPSAHYALGTLLSKLGETDAASEHVAISRRLEADAERYEDLFQEVVRRPDDAGPRCELGEILLKQGQRKEAFAWLLSALRVDQWNSAAHTALARYYADAGNDDMAQRHLGWAARDEKSSENVLSSAH
ncbi:MAG TPA: tetratricopeptide repeat protein [Pirellulales bacterium]|nr:tetratricopeptide repeat protein [Pirellulales bacterium]